MTAIGKIMSVLVTEPITTTVVAVVEQEHRGSRWPTTTDPDSAAPEAEIPAESDRRREERNEKAQNYRREKMSS